MSRYLSFDITASVNSDHRYSPISAGSVMLWTLDRTYHDLIMRTDMARSGVGWHFCIATRTHVISLVGFRLR